MMAETLAASMALRSTPTMPRLPARQRRRLALGLSLAGWISVCGVLIGTRPTAAQDLVGCQLVDGSLQCVPGLTASPQQQIQIMRKEISTDIRLEGAVQQQINGLQSLVLKGQAVEGGLLAATAATETLAALPAPAYHWYRLTPGQTRWQLIQGATGPSYVLTAADVGQQILVVVVVRQVDGSVQRVPSAATAPVQGQAPLKP